jgi:hypothetical protein
MEVHQEWGSGWVSQVVRVYEKEEARVEFTWTIGPIPTELVIIKHLHVHE